MERRKRRWWTRAVTWVSVLAVIAAVLSGLFQLALSAAPGWRDELAVRVSQQTGAPVRIGDMRLAWRWLWPMLEFRDVVLLTPQGEPQLSVQRLRLGFALLDMLRGSSQPREVDIHGVQLAVDIDTQGRARLRGLTGSDTLPDSAALAQRLRQFARLRATRVDLALADARAPTGNFALTVERADLRLDAGQGFELRLDMQAPQLLADRIQLKAGLAGPLHQPQQWQGRWRLVAEGITRSNALAARWPALARLQVQGAGLDASGDWAQGLPGESTLQLHADTLQLAARAGQKAVQWQQLQADLHYQPQAGGGQLQARRLQLQGPRGAWPASSLRLAWSQQPEGLRWQGGAEFLRLDDLAPWLSLFEEPPGHGPAANRYAQAATVTGDLRGVEFRHSPASGAQPPRYALTAAFSDVGAGSRNAARVQGLSGEISADETGGRLRLQGAGAEAHWPARFSAPLVFDELSTQLHWSRQDRSPDGALHWGWKISAENLQLALRGARAEGQLTLRHFPADASGTAASPHLQLNLQLSAADVARLKPLMPLHWGPNFRRWMTRALVSGRVRQGQLRIDGPLADFPYHRAATGEWALDLALDRTRLDYHADWPGAENLSAQLNLRGNGLSFQNARAQIAGVDVRSAQGRIEDFNHSMLEIDGSTAGDAVHYYDFLRNSPLAQRLSGLVNHTQAEGPAEADVRLDIALHSQTPQKSQARGDVRLLGNRLRVNALDEPLENLRGSLHFGGNGLSASDLAAQIYDTAVEARIAPGSSGSDEISARFTLAPDAAQGLAARYVPAWLRPQLHGSSVWQLQLPVAGAEAGRVRLASDLVGVASRLPPPLAKTAAESLPLTLALSTDDTTPLRLHLDIPGRVGMALRFARERGELLTRGVAVQLGGGIPALAATDGIQLTGTVDALQPLPWLALLTGSGQHELPFLGAQLRARRLQWGSHETADVSLNARHDADRNWHLALEGGASGSLQLNSDGTRLHARLARLALQGTAPAPAVAPAVTTAVTPVAQPDRWPALDIAVETLRIGPENFGRAEVRSEPLPGGQKLTAARLSGGVLTLEAQGEWRRTQGLSSGNLGFTVESGDLAAALRAFGFAPTLTGRNARIGADLRWQPAAAGLDWAQAQGGMEIHAESGALRAFEPGAGSRVLGLLNFYALPRRLLFDFRDVAGKGFGFDRLHGRFALADGVAETNDLDIKGPSLRMEVRGTVGLADRSYDQRVNVYPDTSGLTLGAVLVGGAGLAAAPALGVVALIANQVLDKPLGQATQLSYRVTGPWDNPEIRKLDTPAIPAESP